MLPRIIMWVSVLFALVAPCIAEQLPIKSYTTADGLARDSVSRIVQDSRGFLWFATAEGLSRFDGYRFTNYGVEQGLPHRSINDLLETRTGVYWIATEAGLCRFNPNGTARAYLTAESGNQLPQATTGTNANAGPMFVVYHSEGSPRSEIINALLEDHTGVIWYGTNDGLYRLEQVGNTWKPQAVEIGLPREVTDDTHINTLVEDRHGSLWIGTMSGLYRRGPDRVVERYTTQQGLPANNVRSLLEDRDGQLWAGTSLGLVLLISNPDRGSTIVARSYPAPNVNALLHTSNRKLLVSSNGLCELDLAMPIESRALHCYAKAPGLSDSIQTLAEDRAGNLWIGTTSEGVMKLARNGFTSYSEADGLGGPGIAAIFEDRAGELCVMAGNPLTPISSFDGKSFKPTGVRQPNGKGHSWGWYQVGFQDSAGDWWIPTADGLYRYAATQGSQSLGLSISDLSQAEGNSGATAFNFNVTLSAASAQTVTVNYATTAGGTATVGNDYQPVSGTLTFAAGDTIKPVTVIVNGDAQDEPNETFFVQLSGQTNATLSKAQGIGTIINDDAVAAPSLQFSASGYSVQEDLTAAKITVTRSGDTSVSATVDYATSNGTASQRGDYELASGTVSFAPGETSKNFSVLINEDSYVEGTETVNLTLSNPSGASLGAQTTAVLNIIDDAVESATNPNDDAQNFVYQQYHDLLNREPDAGGLAYWTGQITQCGTDQTCINTKRKDLSAAFYIELEFQETGYFVYRIQKASYGLQPTYQQFMADRGQVKGGPQLEQSKQTFAAAWVQRAAFKAVYPDALPADQFVNKLYDTAGLMGYQTARLQAIQDLLTNTRTRAQVLRDVLETPEFKTKEYNPSFVLMQYFGYLRRNADPAGYQFWLNVINNQLPNDLSGYHSMVCAFITSAEYQDRFSAVHTHGNAECGQ